jgi:hypothetical protein
MDKQHTDEKLLLDVHEAAALLDISEEELWALTREHKVPTHNIAGAFLRFKKQDIEALKNKWRIERELFPEKEQFFSHHNTVGRMSAFDRLADFWYFNDFYIICSLLIVVLLYFIVSTQ